MKSIWKDFLISVVMGLIVPGIVLDLCVVLMEKRQMDIPPAEVSDEVTVPQPMPAALPMLLRKGAEPPVEMDMDSYLVGVLLAEMPAYFELGALKAQAVVARTYTRKAYLTGGKHKDGSVCTEPSCCQGYLSETDYCSSGGKPEDVEKIRAAVLATSGQVLTYEGELIEATYFSCSGGRTEDASAVWGQEFAYLQSVESPGEETAAHFSDVETISTEAFAAALDINVQEDPASWVGMTTYTEGGGVYTIVIGGKTFLGTEIRSLLGLRSTAFSIAVKEDAVTITTKGYGHRVGMSQFGADAMAVAGSTYDAILAHYYPGTELHRISR